MRKIALISLILSSILMANDSVVLDKGNVVVKGKMGESIIISDAADKDAVVVGSNNILISSKKKQMPSYASGSIHQIDDISYDTVEIKHSNQYVGTAEVPVIYQLHPLTVHQYK